MRALSNKFFNDLTNANGLLHPILTQVKQDHTLMLAIRDNYINIYYRGGNLLKVTEQGKGYYQTSFDDQYNKFGKSWGSHLHMSFIANPKYKSDYLSLMKA